MKYSIFNYKDKKLKCFDAPILSTEAPSNYLNSVKRSVVRAKPIDLQFARDKSLYFFGYFDDEEGKFELLAEPQKLADIEDFCPSMTKAIEDYIESDFHDEANDELVARYRLKLKKQQVKEGETNA